MTDAVRILQIFYDERSRAALDPAFEPLDNSAHARRDWYEYWPIRRFLDEVPLEGSTYYGFLSPRFREKTGLSGAEVRQFVAASAGADVITFSPYPETSVFDLNVFHQGERCHPGLMAAAVGFFHAIGQSANLPQIVMDASNSVFCNYFVARPAFWRAWRAVLDQCVRLADDASSPLHRLLREPTWHDGIHGPQMKVFVMERVASLMLSTQGRWATINYAPFRLPAQRAEWAGVWPQLVALDALKRSYRQSADASFLEAFHALRVAVVEQLVQAAGSARESLAAQQANGAPPPGRGT